MCTGVICVPYFRLKDPIILLSFRLNLQITETLGFFLKTMFEGIQCMFSFLGLVQPSNL